MSSLEGDRPSWGKFAPPPVPWKEIETNEQFLDQVAEYVVTTTQYCTCYDNGLMVQKDGSKVVIQDHIRGLLAKLYIYAYKEGERAKS